jgi:hypothetical protein
MKGVGINVHLCLSINPSLIYLTSEVSRPQCRSESRLNIKMGKIYVFTLM